MKIECEHGKMIGKAGKTLWHGKFWAGFFCPNNQCKARFLKVQQPKGESDE